MGTEKINRLKIVLVEQGKTGKWLAGQLGKNEATVSRWCSNVSQPSLEMLMKIASILDIDDFFMSFFNKFSLAKSTISAKSSSDKEPSDASCDFTKSSI